MIWLAVGGSQKIAVVSNNMVAGIEVSILARKFYK